MSPTEVRSMGDRDIVEMLVNLHAGSDEAVAWLASVISDPAKIEGVSELSRRYEAKLRGHRRLPRAKSAGTVHIDGAKLKEMFWRRRLPLNSVGPMIGKCEGLISVLAHKGHMSYWTADAIATEVLDMHVDAFLAEVATPEEQQRLSA